MIEENINNKIILAVVVVYNPDIELLQHNVESFRKFVDKVIIWNNTPGDFQHITCKLQGHFDNIEYQGDGKNVGISKALNTVLNYAIKEGFEYILTMDQDSIWSDFGKYKDAVIKKNKIESCICGPYALDSINKKPPYKDFQPFRWQITSGMLVKTAILDIIGGYNEFFKVDCVDIELCLRAKARGYSSYFCPAGFLLQRYGEPYSRKIFGRKICYVYYNPVRIKGILEGHILLYRFYKNPFLKIEVRRYLNNAVRSILFGRKVPRLSLLKAIVEGFLRGFFYPLSKVFV